MFGLETLDIVIGRWLRILTGVGLLVASTTVCGCTSVQWLDATGRPRSFGLANIVPAETDEAVTRIVAPGVALRLIGGLGGYSLGWRETVLFQTSDRDGHRELVAFADRMYGIAIDAGQVVIGAAHRFAVFEPTEPTDVIQVLYYDEADPTVSRIRTQEVR